MLQWTPHGRHVAECRKTGAYLDVSREQWTLVYERGECGKPGYVYKTRHWQRAKVPASEILAKAQRSLDRLVRAS
jgi:hypothetical protein